MSNIIDLYNEYHLLEFSVKDVTIGMKLRIITSIFGKFADGHTPEVGDIATVVSYLYTDMCTDNHCRNCPCGHRPFFFTIKERKDEQFSACYAIFETLDGKKIV